MHSPDMIGLVGVLLVIIAYFLLQTDRMKAGNILYSALNAVGSAMIIYSLFFKWNLSAFAMEGIWLLLSLYGVVKSFRLKRSEKI